MGGPRPDRDRGACRRLARHLVVVACVAAACAVQAQPRCADEEPVDEAAPAATPEAARELGVLVQRAVDASRGVGAARALAAAAARDVDETRATTLPQASLQANLGPTIARSGGATASQLAQGGVSLGISQLLWDGGRSAHLVDWRSQLAESARLALLTQQEQTALAAVSIALDRARYVAHEKVYGQYVRKMACLAESLETIVAADRGRASELLQVKKAQQQAEISRAAAESQRRQAEIRLERLLGGTAPAADGIGALLQPLPELAPLLAATDRANDIGQLAAQALAASRLADSVAAGTRPQVSWTLAGTRSLVIGGNVGTQHGSALSAGLTLVVPLTHTGTAAATDAARSRALAAQEQLADAVDARRARVREVHEQARSSIDRAERVRAVLRDSERVREATLLQWQQLGRRSLFDVMGAEAEHYNLRVSWVNSLVDAQQLGATLRSLGPGLVGWQQAR